MPSCTAASKTVIYYRPQTKLRKGNVFTPVCQSFCSQGRVSAPVHAGIHLPGQTPPRQTPSTRADTSHLDRHPYPGRHTPGQTPPGQTPPQQTAAAADGTYPTGMHSYY